MRVLVAIDADASHEGVLDWARRFPTYLREPPHLTLLHVVPIPLEGIAGVQDQTYDLDLAHLKASIRERLLTLPGSTTVRTGHGPTTTIAAEAPHLAEWIERGH